MTKAKETNELKSSLKKLEELTEWFQEKDIDLDVGLKKLKEGIEIIKTCRSKIKEIEKDAIAADKDNLSSHGIQQCIPSIHAGPGDDAAALARARAWWGEVTSTHDGTSTSAPLTGLMWNVAHQECAQAEHTGLALEYGTLPLAEVLDALRADHWLENHPEADVVLAAAIKRQIRDAFYVDTDEWKQRIVEQGLVAARQAVAGLAMSMMTTQAAPTGLS